MLHSRSWGSGQVEPRWHTVTGVGAEAATDLFFELFDGLPRQGPGDPASTRRALELLPPLGARARVLDVGCGTGGATLPLARHTPARVTALDRHAPFVLELRRQARAAGLADRLQAIVGDMARIAFRSGSFDAVWCEGAAYVLGIEPALRAWRELLRPGGHVALTDSCWLAPDPSPECAAFWQAEYPAMTDVAGVLAAAGRAGYSLVGHFTLPDQAWWSDYYDPLGRNLAAFAARHAGQPEALELAASVEREIDARHRFAPWYGYVFFVLRR